MATTRRTTALPPSPTPPLCRGRRRWPAPRCSRRSAPRTSASTSATSPRASGSSPTSSPAPAPGYRRLALVGHRRPRPRGRRPSPSTRSCCCPATRRSWRPPWVPYRERIQPGDLSPGRPAARRGRRPAPGARRTPSATTRSTPTTRRRSAQVADDLGLGRVRTLSPEGRDLAAQRWYDGDGGPESPLAQSRPGRLHDLWLPGPARRPARRSCSACAPTATPTTTAGWSRSTTAAAPTPRSSWPRSTSRSPLPDPVFDTLSPDEVETF